MHKIKQKHSAYLRKTIQCAMPCLSHKFTLINFPAPRTFLKISRFAMLVRGPILWNNFLAKDEIENEILCYSNKGLKKK